MNRNDLYPLALGAAQLYLFGKLLPFTQLVVKSRAVSSGNVASLIALGLAGLGCYLLFSNVVLVVGYLKQTENNQNLNWLHQIAIQTIALMGIILGLSLAVSF